MTAARLTAIAAVYLLSASAQDIAKFSTEVRMVEVYATVLDHKGHYLGGLKQDQFVVRDNGERQSISVFEPNANAISCAVLMDTTGSMAQALPVVKSAIVRLIDDLPEQARVAVFTFSNALNTLQDFTSDKKAAKQSVLRTRAGGETALFDALVMLSRRISRQQGKKFIVVFTDGDDNASYLKAASAIVRAKEVGVPVYAVAQGEAVHSSRLMKVLKEVADRTGGLAYQVKKPAEIEKVFLDISEEIQHTYMLAYRAPQTPANEWRRIDVAVTGLRNGFIRARQGYMP